MLINPHVDMGFEYRLPARLGLNQSACDPSTWRSFLLPIKTPPDAGLLWWTRRDARSTTTTPDSVELRPNEIVERETLYRYGQLVSFPVTLAHTIRPFTYFEWRRTQWRITVQAFGVRCGDMWYFQH